MGNAQKKLGLAKKGKKENRTSGSRSSDVNSELQDLLCKGPIENFYDVNQNMILGRGHYAIVQLGMCKRTGKHVAIKRIQISKSRVEALQREVNVLRKIGSHPNIVTLFDIFITNNELLLVLELLKGGELFDRMVEKGPYSEREASHHVRKIGLALKYLHRHGIVHRDLKPENLLLADKTDDSELKIADFGLSKIVDDVSSSTMQTVCGTWAYCAPEVKTSVSPGATSSNGQAVAAYTGAVDLWSVGVILFVILAAYHPFDPDGDASDAVLWERICSGVFDFNDPAWDNISDLAKDLIRNLIVVDPQKRYTTDQLLSHPWVNLTASIPATPITPRIDRSLGGFVNKKRAATPRSMLGTAQPDQNYSQMQNGQNQQFFQPAQFQPKEQMAYGGAVQPQPFQQPMQPQFNQAPGFGGAGMNMMGTQEQVQFHHIGGQQIVSNSQGFAPNQNIGMNHIVDTHQQQGNQNTQQVRFDPQQNPGLTLDTLVKNDNDNMDMN